MCSAKIVPIDSHLLEQLSFDYLEELELPLFASYVAAGFPSPADDYLEERIDLGKYLVQNPTSTFMMRVKGTISRLHSFEGLKANAVFFVSINFQPYINRETITIQGCLFL